MSKIRIKGDTSGFVDLETSATGSNLSVIGNALKVDAINEKTSGNGVHIPGHFIQTVRSEYRTYTTTSSSAFVATGLTATITPKFSNSKILITLIVNGLFKNNNGQFIALSLYRGSSSNAVLDTSVGYNTAGDEINYGIHSNVYQHEDSPSTTSATTYTLYWRSSDAQTIGINNYNLLNGDSLSTITLQEIAQ